MCKHDHQSGDNRQEHHGGICSGDAATRGGAQGGFDHQHYCQHHHWESNNDNVIPSSHPPPPPSMQRNDNEHLRVGLSNTPVCNFKHACLCGLGGDFTIISFPLPIITACFAFHCHFVCGWWELISNGGIMVCGNLLGTHDHHSAKLHLHDQHHH